MQLSAKKRRNGASRRASAAIRRAQRLLASARLWMAESERGIPQDQPGKRDMLKVNEYCEGKAKSISLARGEGPATVGVMEKGSYEFGTSTKEILIVTTGELRVKLPGSAE